MAKFLRISPQTPPRGYEAPPISSNAGFAPMWSSAGLVSNSRIKWAFLQCITSSLRLRDGLGHKCLLTAHVLNAWSSVDDATGGVEGLGGEAA